MIRVITMTHQCGSGGTQLAFSMARKFGWELLDHDLVDRIARIAGLDLVTAAEFDAQAARWWRRLRRAGINPAACCPYVSPRWLDEVDEDSVHALASATDPGSGGFRRMRRRRTWSSMLAAGPAGRLPCFCLCASREASSGAAGSLA